MTATQSVYGDFFMPKEVHCAHLLVKTEQEANDIKGKIDRKEEKFPKMAKRFSTCPSKEDGGDLGWFGRGAMVPEFEEMAFKMVPNKCSKPVKTQFGYHLIWVFETRGEDE